MKRAWIVGGVVGLMALAPGVGRAAEHGGQEHGEHEHGGTSTTTQEHGGTTTATQEHGGKAQAEPTAGAIRQAIRDYIAATEKAEGKFTIEDEVTGTTRTLTLERVHERVGKTGTYFYSCTDMRDTQSGERLDLDFDVDASAGALRVVDVRIHKLDGKPRYTYDERDNRIPAM